MTEQARTIDPVHGKALFEKMRGCTDFGAIGDGTFTAKWYYQPYCDGTDWWVGVRESGPLDRINVCGPMAYEQVRLFIDSHTAARKAHLSAMIERFGKEKK